MDYDKPDIFILNALDKDVRVQVFGNWFTMKSKQVKRMRHEIGEFLESRKGYCGLISLPIEFEDAEWAASDAGKAKFQERVAEGINRRCQHLTLIVSNLQNSLRQDMDAADMKMGVETQATDGELSAMDELLAHQRELADPQKERSERARVALRRVQASQNTVLNPVKKD